MPDRPSSSSEQSESERVWQEIRNDLLRIYENVVGILTFRAITLFEILERSDYVAIVQSSVLNVMIRGDYHRALENLRDFILENPVLDQILPQLTDEVEPGLRALDQWSKEYRLSELL